MSRQQAWDAYWGEQRLAACLRDPGGNYGGCIAQAWRDFFSSLESRSRVLDLAAGNGAVALLGLEASDQDGLDLRIEACDAAQVDPSRSLPEHADALGRIGFRGGIPAERLSYPDRRFDAVTSQYGIEYADWTRALKEVARVLKPGGAVMMICHATASSVYATTCRQLESLDALRQKDLPQRVRALLDSEAVGGAAHQENKRQFAEQAAKVMQALDRSAAADRVFIGQFLQRLGDIYQQRGFAGRQGTQDALDRLEQDLALHAARLQALVEAALDPQGVARFARAMAGAGLEITEHGALVDETDTSTLGWRFQARRSGDG